MAGIEVKDSSFSASEWKQAELDTSYAVNRPRALRFNAAGNVNIRDWKGNEFAYAVSAGETLSCRPVMILSSGTNIAPTAIAAQW